MEGKGQTREQAPAVLASSPAQAVVLPAQPRHSCSLRCISIATRFTARRALLWAACNAFVPWADRAARTWGTTVHGWGRVEGLSSLPQPRALPWQNHRGTGWAPGALGWNGGRQRPRAPGPQGPALRADGSGFPTQDISVIKPSWTGSFDKCLYLKTLKEKHLPGGADTTELRPPDTKRLWLDHPPLGPENQGDALALMQPWLAPHLLPSSSPPSPNLCSWPLLLAAWAEEAKGPCECRW